MTRLYFRRVVIARACVFVAVPSKHSNKVIRAGLRALQEHDAAVDRWLRDEVVPIAAAMQADPGRAISADRVFGEIRDLSTKGNTSREPCLVFRDAGRRKSRDSYLVTRTDFASPHGEICRLDPQSSDQVSGWMDKAGSAMLKAGPPFMLSQSSALNMRP